MDQIFNFTIIFIAPSKASLYKKFAGNFKIGLEKDLGANLNPLLSQVMVGENRERM